MRVIFGSILVCLVCVLWADPSSSLCVKATKANLRTGPGTTYEVGWTVNKYMPFKKVGTSVSGDWYAVEDVDGVVLWIHRSLVTDQHRCAVVKDDGVNIRTGPGTQHEKKSSDPAEKYYCGKVVDHKGSWVRVMDEAGDRGWIHTDFLWTQ